MVFWLQGESLVCEVGLDALQGLYIHPFVGDMLPIGAWCELKFLKIAKCITSFII